MDTLKNIDIRKLLNPAYIFEKTPPADLASSYYIYLAFLFGFLIILALAAWFGYGRLKKEMPLWSKMQGRVFNIFFYTGITGLILLFFRFEQIAYLGSRFFLGLLALVFIIWGIYILYFRLRIFPKEIKEYKDRQNFERFLPSSRKVNK